MPWRKDEATGGDGSGLMREVVNELWKYVKGAGVGGCVRDS